MEANPKSDSDIPATATKAPDSELSPSSDAEIGLSGADAPSASRNGGRDDENAALEKDLRQAYQEYKNASNEEEKVQASKKLKELMSSHKEQYQSTAPNVEERYLPTKQLWNEADARKQDSTAPRSAFTNQRKDLFLAESRPQPSISAQSDTQVELETKDHLVQKAKSAEARWRAAPLRSKERSQALSEFEEAEDKLKEQYPEPAEEYIMECKVPTENLWREADARIQEPTAPKSAHPKKIKGILDYNDNTNDSLGQNANAGWQESRMSSTATPDAASGIQQEDSGMQPASQRGGSTADGGRSRSIRNMLLPSAGNDYQNEVDLEAGTKQKPDKKGRTDDHDVHGRKRIFAPKRDERIVDPVPKKCNYGPGAIPLPEPTYLDRQGRTELEVFQALVGIHFLANAGAPIDNKAKQLQPASVMSDIFLPSRAAAYRHRNRGLYDRCISQDMKMRVMYSFSHYMISFLYLLQILVAATLTGLSSYTNTAGVALTTLGAINTVLAGILAWLNGQGMPVRYRRSRDQYREVVRAIEDAERMFSTIDYVEWPAGTRPTPVGERDKLFKMYEKARQDQEANYPDTHENADKSEVANHTKELEAKIEKHKKQKKAKAAELQTALDKLQEKHAAKSDDSESTAAESNQESSDHSKIDLDKWAQRLEVRQRNADLALAGLARERDQAHEDFEAMKQIIKNMCSKENLEPEQVRSKLAARKESEK